MPELPEVETIKKQLEVHLPIDITKTSFSKCHKSIVKTKEFGPDSFKILSFYRHGKNLIFNLDKERFIYSNFGMSGGWRVSTTPIKEKHGHINLIGKNSSGAIYLSYVDPRRFGKMHFVGRENLKILIDKLGVDISTPSFTKEYVAGVFKKHPKRPLKPLLLEQKYFAGIGNYIACEICARSKIHPTRLAGDIKPNEIKKIIKATAIVLEGSIKTNGLTFHGGYSDASGDKGRGLQHLVVFYQPVCRMCKITKIEKITLAGRGTYFCPSCQK